VIFDIKQAIEEGIIVCHPFHLEHLNHTSLDITLGNYYLRISNQGEKSIYNPFDEGDVELHFDGPTKAITHGEWCSINGFKPVDNIPLDHPVISIGPKERILAHTHEFIGVLSPNVAEVRCRSNLSRNGVMISLSSGGIEPNRINRYSLIVYNSNERSTILLPVGERIAQLVFWHKARERDRDSTASHWRVGLDTAIKGWTPDRLLPH